MSDNRFFLENDKMTNDNLDNVTLGGLSFPE